MNNLIELNSDGRDLFRSAYENRYTWGSDFQGYTGLSTLKSDFGSFNGSFSIGSDLNPQLANIADEDAKKLIHAQLWEVAIHRIKRPFDEVHGQNTFKINSIENSEVEVQVGGKNAGDKYKIKDKIITMVHRNIHGKLITINTKNVIETGSGYLSTEYTSQYKDPITKENISSERHFFDEFRPICVNGPWVLEKRIIHTHPFRDKPSSSDTYLFTDLNKL